MANERRRSRQGVQIGSTSFLIVGMLLGLVGGLVYAWLLNPVVLTNATPARFSPIFQDEYVYLVSQSYAVDRDLGRVQARLAALGVEDMPAFISTQLETYLRQGRPADVVQNLATLAKDLGVEGQAVSFFGPTAVPATATATVELIVPAFTPTLLPTFTPTPAPSATFPPTPIPSRTPQPTATLVPAFRLLNQQRACQNDQALPHLQIITLDALLDPLPGVEVIVSWDGGEDRFFTGFKPSLGLGYGDFDMTDDTSYSVTLADGSDEVSGLRVERCPASEGGLDGGWRLTFQSLRLNAVEESEE